MSRPRFLPRVLAMLPAAMLLACGSSTLTSTAPSPATRCDVTVSGTDVMIPAGGGAGAITVATARECAWTAASDASWLRITGPPAGQGDGTLQFSAAGNPDPAVRRGVLMVNETRAELTQAAGVCAVQLAAPSASFGQTGGGGTVHVVASSPLCSWVASADVEWITITSAANGQGTATISFRVSPTTEPARTGTITVAGQQFVVTQSVACAYAITPMSHSVGAAGGTGTVAVATASECPWIAASNAPWITLTSANTMVGPGQVAFSVAPTAGPARTGTVTVAGQTFTVSQSSPDCTYTIAPESLAVPASGGPGTITVTAGAGCAWTASSSVAWIAITAGTSGSGSGTVAIGVAPNPGPARTGTVSAASQTFTVHQAGACEYAIAPQEQAIGAAGGTVEVGVTVASGCAWTASSNATWIAVTSGAAGTGTGTVRLAVSANTATARSGSVTIAGRTFTVLQAAASPEPDPPCVTGVSPASRTAGSSGGAAALTVVAPNTCAWTAISNVPWIAIVGTGSGTGNGRVDYTVLPNTGPERSGTITAGGQTFTVIQQGG